MKALRYLLIIMSLVSVLNVSAQMPNQSEWGKQPVAQMRSTSVMAYSGSTLPLAAATGVTLASGSAPSANAPASYRPGHIRRVIDDEDKEEKPEGWVDPYKDPLGDVLWPLMLMALAYVVYLTSRKKKENI